MKPDAKVTEISYYLTHNLLTGCLSMISASGCLGLYFTHSLSSHISRPSLHGQSAFVEQGFLKILWHWKRMGTRVDVLWVSQGTLILLPEDLNDWMVQPTNLSRNLDPPPSPPGEELKTLTLFTDKAKKTDTLLKTQTRKMSPYSREKQKLKKR